jgi:hypothetical protein
MDNGKPQQFPYSYKTVAIPVNSQYVFNKPELEIINPINLFTVEFLMTHVRILFDASTPTPQKVLSRVTVTGLDDNGFTVREARGVNINKAAVSNIVDATIDLSPFIYKTGRNLITLEFPSTDGTSPGPIFGTSILQIWKADMAYTVKGVAR